MMEIWHDIEGYEGLYQISNKGRVKSLYKGSERILKPRLNSSGYYFITLCNDSVSKQFQLHRLVAQAFIPNLYNKPQVNHLDENKLNNCVNNLEWVTAKENNNYGTRNERITGRPFIPILQYSKDGEFIKEWPSALEVKRVLGIHNTSIIQCCKGKYKSSGGFVWKYKEEKD